MLATKNPYIKSAYEQLQIIGQDKQKRLDYEAREKAIRDHNQMMYEAEQRRAIEIAKNLLAFGIDEKSYMNAEFCSFFIVSMYSRQFMGIRCTGCRIGFKLFSNLQFRHQ